ncbi:MAG: M14 family metallocarboxypeptidase [Candidatus Magasanikbacteria bacterium]|nr:M14 family metallocarboxypeptidase [Candidatus Magasanikbacteria bacterium]
MQKTGNYAPYIRELHRVCERKKIPLTTLGMVGKNHEYPLYQVTLGNPARAKRIICFSAGIHGDEESGPWAIVAFLNRIPRLPAHIAIIMFPLVNPYGFDRHQYRNEDNRNLNRHFLDHKPAPENVLLKKALKPYQLFFFAALHEDEEQRGSYLFAYTKEPHEPAIYRNLIGIAKKYGPVVTKKRIYWHRGNNGLVLNPRSDGSLEEFVHKKGAPFSICTEMPDAFPLKKRIAILLAQMRAIIAFSAKQS